MQIDCDSIHLPLGFGSIPLRVKELCDPLVGESLGNSHFGFLGKHADHVTSTVKVVTNGAEALALKVKKPLAWKFVANG